MKIDITIVFSVKRAVRKYILCYTFIHKISNDIVSCTITYLKQFFSIGLLTSLRWRFTWRPCDWSPETKLNDNITHCTEVQRDQTISLFVNSCLRVSQLCLAGKACVSLRSLMNLNSSHSFTRQANDRKLILPFFSVETLSK